jgi:hypothetical protein
MIGRKTRRGGGKNVGGSRELEDDSRVVDGSPTGLNTTALPHSFSSSATLVSITPIIVFPRHESWSTSSTHGSSEGTLVGSRAGSDEGGS